MTYTPAGYRVKSPVTFTISTTGDFSDTTDGLGCDNPVFISWAIRLVRDGWEEFLGAVHDGSVGNATEALSLSLGSYAAEIQCRTADDETGGGNNPELTAEFVVVPWEYSRTPSGTVGASQMSFGVTFGDFSQTECDPAANYWGLEFFDVLSAQQGLSAFVSSTTLSHTFLMTMPTAEYGTVAVTCSVDGVAYNNGVVIEGGIDSLLWTVPAMGSSPQDPPAARRANYSDQTMPTMGFVSPRADEVFGDVMRIRYSSQYDTDATISGLTPTFVALYYLPHTEGSEIDNAPNAVSNFGKDVPDFLPSESVLIAKDLPPTGSYDWDTRSLPESNDGRLILLVSDNRGFSFRAYTKQIAIDHTPPTFIISADPPVSGGESVQITVEASEELSATTTPVVYVKQNGTRAFPVAMAGSGKKFTGMYQVISGWDGEAQVTVVGQDKAGNIGTLVLSGGQFYVGVEPPPKPIILSPLDFDVVADAVISVEGLARHDTEIFLVLNGTTTYSTRPAKDGKFRFAHITLDPKFERGQNTLALTSRDKARNISETAIRRVKYNRPPRVTFESPATGTTVEGVANVRLSVLDDNDDQLRFTFEYTNDGEHWQLLGKNISERQYRFRTMDVPDGTYKLRAAVHDGFASAHATSSEFTIRNYLPVITFVGGPMLTTNNTSATIMGNVKSQKPPLSATATITALEYRIDDDGEWREIEYVGEGASSERTFSITLETKKEGIYKAAFRARDSRGFFGRALKTVISDFGPPAQPVIQVPKKHTIISDADDAEKERAGAQFSMSVFAEPKSMVLVRAPESDQIEAETSTSGIATLHGVTLRKHGSNMLSVVAVDAAGNMSKEATVKLQYNNPPTLRLLSPRKGYGVGKTAKLKIERRDPDGDSVGPVTLSYRKGNGSWAEFERNIEGGEYTWDTRGMSEGKDYELKITASDGVSVGEYSQKITIDHTMPALTHPHFPSTTFNKAFRLYVEGEASDALSGVALVEYSLGEEWWKALVTSGYLMNDTHWKVDHPLVLEDGEYTLRFRATDASGNVSEEARQTIVIDTTPPRVGSFRLDRGNLQLYPEYLADDQKELSDVLGTARAFRAAAGAKLSFAISMERDTEFAVLALIPLAPTAPDIGVDVKEFALTRTPNGLFGADVIVPNVGGFTMVITARDRLGNSSGEVPVGVLAVKESGKILSGGMSVHGADVSVLVFNEEQQSYLQWNGDPYGIPQHVTTDEGGRYSLFLPRGTYKLEVNKSGFQRLRSTSFTLTEPSFIGFDLTLMPRTGIRGVLEDIIQGIGG